MRKPGAKQALGLVAAIEPIDEARHLSSDSHRGRRLIVDPLAPGGTGDNLHRTIGIVSPCARPKDPPRVGGDDQLPGLATSPPAALSIPMRPMPFLPVFLSPISSLGFLLMRPKLLGLAILPTLLNLLIFLGLFMALDRFVVAPVSDSEPTGVAFLDGIISVVARLVLSLLALVIGGIVFFVLVIPLNAPFCDMISERIERELLRDAPELIATPPKFSTSIGHTVRDALRRILFVLPFYAVIVVISFVPIIGTLIAATLGFCLNGLFLALDGYSYPMDRRLMPFPAKWAFLKANRGIWIPLAAGLAVLLAIPCNLLWLPIVSSTAATRVYCRHLKGRDDV